MFVNISIFKRVNLYEVYIFFLVDHLSKYLAMRLTLDLVPELPERALSFLIYVSPSSDQYVPLNGNQTLRQVHDKYWKMNKPLEMFYSFN